MTGVERDAQVGQPLSEPCLRNPGGVSFGRESKDIVVFEDLDRFEEPHIFEALRELNILLNEIPERRAKDPAPLVRGLLARLSEGTPDKLAAKPAVPVGSPPPGSRRSAAVRVRRQGQRLREDRRHPRR
jgi:hypothetical protein